MDILVYKLDGFVHGMGIIINLQAMVVVMEKCASSMVDEWEKKLRDGGGHVELEVGDYMTHVTADIISHTAFGSSYEKGKKVFEQQVALISYWSKKETTIWCNARIQVHSFIHVIFFKYLLLIINLIWRRLLCPNAFFSSWLYGFECLFYTIDIDAPPSSLLDSKRVQLCQNAKVVEIWCRSQLLALKGVRGAC
jgi:hypothetical protein